MTSRKFDLPLKRTDLPNDLSARLTTLVNSAPEGLFIGDGQLDAAFSAAMFNYGPSRLSGHPFTKAVVVFSFSI